MTSGQNTILWPVVKIPYDDQWSKYCIMTSGQNTILWPVVKIPYDDHWSKYHMMTRRRKYHYMKTSCHNAKNNVPTEERGVYSMSVWPKYINHHHLRSILFRHTDCQNRAGQSLHLMLILYQYVLHTALVLHYSTWLKYMMDNVFMRYIECGHI